MRVSLKLLALAVVAGALAGGTAFAAPGGNNGKGSGGGGSGGGGSGEDPCATTSSFFPSIAYVVNNGNRKATELVIYLASADAACARPVLALTESVVDAPMQLHARDDGTGFLVVLERQHYTHRVVMRDFVVGPDNVVAVTGSQILLERVWDPDSQSGSSLQNIGLSPDGDWLLITATDTDAGGFVSSVLSCSTAASPCTPEALLTSAVVDGSYFFWAVAPSADPDRFFVTNTYEGAVDFPRYHLTVASRDAGGAWTLAVDNPVAQSDGNLFYPDADPFNPDRIAWADLGVPWVTPETVQVCTLDSDGVCVVGWSLPDARVPTWSRRGRLAQPEHGIPSLLYRGTTSKGKVAHFETVDGLVLEPLPVSSSVRWDAF